MSDALDAVIDDEWQRPMLLRVCAPRAGDADLEAVTDMLPRLPPAARVTVVRELQARTAGRQLVKDAVIFDQPSYRAREANGHHLTEAEKSLRRDQADTAAICAELEGLAGDLDARDLTVDGHPTEHQLRAILTAASQNCPPRHRTEMVETVMEAVARRDQHLEGDNLLPPHPGPSRLPSEEDLIREYRLADPENISPHPSPAAAHVYQRLIVDHAWDLIRSTVEQTADHRDGAASAGQVGRQAS